MIKHKLIDGKKWQSKSFVVYSIVQHISFSETFYTDSGESRCRHILTEYMTFQGHLGLRSPVFELPGGWGVEPPQLFSQPP